MDTLDRMTPPPAKTSHACPGGRRATLARAGALAFAIAFTGGCADRMPRVDDVARVAPMAAPVAPKATVSTSETARLLSKDELALLEDPELPVYRIGQGDVLRLDVMGRPEVSGRHVVGPDGVISVPMLGHVNLQASTRDEAVVTLERRLKAYYSTPRVTLAVDEYVSNQVSVFGRVDRSGLHRFAHQPTLIEVLASAGAMPLQDKQTTLRRCAILRGRERLIWVDLQALLAGDSAYNLRMRKGDIVYVPESTETAVYVMGSVQRPGSYRLTARMTVLDALAQAGGLTENSATRVGLYRAGAARVEVIDMAALLDPARRSNHLLEDGDVLFSPTTGLADFGYVMRQIAPAVSVFTFGATLTAIKP
jgi:polysaccharide export outer membrane protein